MFRAVREAFAAFRRQGNVRARLEWSLRTSRAMTLTRTRDHTRESLSSRFPPSRVAGALRNEPSETRARPLQARASPAAPIDGTLEGTTLVFTEQGY